MRPSLRCCNPYHRPFPSGWAWAHSRSCPEQPNQKIAIGMAADRAERHLSVVHEAETRSKGVEVAEPKVLLEPTELHPACEVAIADGVMPCSRCAFLADLETDGADYIGAHLDDGRQG